MAAQFNVPGNDTFTYTGGNLQILTDWTRVGAQTGTAINFYRIASAGKAMGAIGSVALSNATTLTNGSSLGDFRPTIQITYVTVPACQGIPATGGVVSLVQGVCTGTTFTMGIANTLSGSGITYQWQRADDAAFTLNVTNLGTSASQTSTQTSNTYYRCIARCATGPASDTSAPFLMPMNPAYKCICASGAVSTADEDIYNFTFSSLNNSSNCSTLAPGAGSVAQMYSNYQSVPAPSVEKGSTVPFSIQIGTCLSSYPNMSAIFIDYNQNASFSDPGELVYSSPVTLTGAHTESGTVVIPATAATGYVAVRVITSEQSAPITNPCMSYSWGETEDYVINITPTTFCSGAPNPGNTIASTANVCSGSNVFLTLQNTVTGTGIQYQWYNSTGMIPGASSYSYTTPNMFTAETYYCAVTCTNSSLTTNSTPITIGMNSFIDCYCASSAVSETDDDIFSFMFNGTTNVSDCNVAAPGPGSVLNKYANFHPLGALTSVELESTVPFSIQIDDCDLAPYYSFAAAIWIDFNHNGSFADAGEKVFVENLALDGPRYVVGNVTIPCTALTGPTGMRIIEAEGLYGALITPCLSYGYGETEDYIINIVPKSSGIDYSFGSIGSPTSNATAGLPVPNLTVSGITQGNNANTSQTSLLLSNTNTSTYSNASAQMNAGITARNRSLQLTDTSAYYQVTLTPVSGYNVTLDSVKLGTFSSATGPTILDIRTSLDNYASSIGSVNVSANSTWAYVSPVITSMTSVAPMTIRIYGYVAGGSGSVTTGTTAANWFTDDIRLKVSVKCNTACNLTASISNTAIACNGGSTTLTVNALNGIGLINYQLNGGAPQTSNVFTNVAAGSYTVTLTDGNACTASATKVIAQPSIASSTTTVAACNSYTWTSNNQTYSVGGVYMGIGTTTAGCARYDTLNLTLNYGTTSAPQSATACGSYVWNGTTYTTSGMYTYTTLNANGCANTSTLNLTINAITANGSMTATACNSYTWNGTTYAVSGMYTFTSLNAAGCLNTATLTLTINQSSTNGNLTTTACNSYTWNGGTYTNSGVYTFTSLNAAGCVNTATLNLTINATTTNGNATATACNSYTWNGVTYTSSGVYTFTSLNAAGCVNTATLNLTIHQSSTNGNATAAACNSYTWNGVTYTASGVYTLTSLNASGCVNTATLTLTINQSSTNGNLTTTACNSYTWNGGTYTNSGVYTFTSLNAAGCVNTASLNLTINATTTNGNATATACNSYTWNGVTYTSSGVYTFTSLNAAGCVNTATLNLTIHQSSTNGNATAAACNSYTWNGVTYTASGVYTLTSLNASGCVNTATLTLTINQSTTNGNSVVNACDSYTWNGITYTTSGTYTYTSLNASGCVNTATLTLSIFASTTSSTTVIACDTYTWNQTNVSYSTSGVYVSTAINAQGCPITRTLNLTLNQSSSSSVSATACDTYTWSANGLTYTASGVYTKTSLNAAGCTHTLSLLLTITSSISQTSTITACDSYTWPYNMMTYTASGTYTDVNGCHIELLNVTLIPSSSHITIATACDSYTWSVNNSTYSNSGSYNQVAGCHTEVLQLTLAASTSVTNTATACDSYAWNGLTYTASGNYLFTSLNQSGCVNTATLSLLANHSTSSTASVTACDTYTWSQNATTYSVSGTYTSVQTNASGCIHSSVLHVSINHSSTSTFSQSACDAYTWVTNGQTYAQSGVYTSTSINGVGCVHSAILTLSITPSSSNTTTASACDSYYWSVGATSYSASGTYQLVNGCHADNLHLTIAPTTSNSTTISACDMYLWPVNNISYSVNGVYSFSSGCHSDTLHLTITQSSSNLTTVSVCDTYTWLLNNIAYTQSGIYSSTTSCHTETLSLTVVPTTTINAVVTACDTYTWTTNAQTYTSSGTYTSSNACQTSNLNLTINQSSLDTTSTFSIGTYTWAANGQTYSTSGVYSDTSLNASGCLQTNILMLTIAGNACQFALTVDSDQPISCPGDNNASLQASVTPSGSYTYTIVSPTQASSSNTNGYFIQLEAGTHTVIASNGTCAAFQTITFINPDPLDIDFTTDSIVSCLGNDGQLSVFITGGSNILQPYLTWWINSAGDTINDVLNDNFAITLSNLPADNYTVHIEDDFGCFYSETTTLGVSDVIQVNATFVPIVCQGGTTQLLLSSTGGVSYSPLTYSVNGALVSSSYGAGTYTVVATDEKGCTGSTVIIINEPSANVTSSLDSACASFLWNGTVYTQTGTYTATFTSVNGCDSVHTLNLTINNCASVLNLKLFMQGYYISNATMQSVLYNQSETTDMSLTDSVNVILYEAVYPYSAVASQRVVVHTDGTATCIFSPLMGSYYVGIKNRNTLYTWSSNPVALGQIAAMYDFTTSSSMVYGDNAIEMEPGIWALYMGDLNDDENIDLFDLISMEDDISNFLYGYVATDINGDGNADLLDTQVMSDNIGLFIFSMHP
jgi:hypothetical protein